MERYRWAENHDGLITQRVMRADGRDRGAVQGELRSGRVRSIRRGVVAVNGAPPTWRQAVRAVLLSCGDEVAASHGTALRLLGGRVIPSEWIEVLAPMARQVRLDGVRAHRSGVLEPGDIVVVQGMRCTSALRTVVDLSGVLPWKQLGDVVDDLVRRRLLDLEALRSRVNRLRPAPGRRMKVLRAVLAARIPGYDPGESTLEARIMLLLIEHGLPLPTQQLKVEFGPNRYRIDFAWPDRRIYLEGNGFGSHSLSTDLDRDARRQNELVLDGWRPIELTWRMSDEEMRRVLISFLRPRITRP